MRLVFENYENISMDGVIILSQRGLEGVKGDLMEVIEVTGCKDGMYKGKQGRWRTGAYYNPEKYTHEEAISHWKIVNMRKFETVTN